VSEAEVERLIARQQPESRRRESSTNDEALGGLSARNRLHGFVEEVRIDGLLAQVRLRVGNQSLTAVITADAVQALKLRRGDDAIAIIKSTEVMVAKSPQAVSSSRSRTR
jgi:molybdopterin-binding protein